MSDFKKVEFYRGKPSSLPRFVYRRLTRALQAAGDAPEPRSAALTSAVQELLSGGDPDLRKFKFTLPDFLRRILTPEETARFATETEAKRKHAAQLKMVFPHVSDEFSLNPEFLESVLHFGGGPEVPRTGRFFTIGSCFARNIAEFLKNNGVVAETYALAEDLNSPISNAFIFHLLRQSPEARLAIVADWVSRIFPEMAPDQVQAAAGIRCEGIDQLARQLVGADCVVLTLGNVVDFFREGADADLPLVEKIFPKFVAMPSSEDIGQRANAAARAKKLGATLRLASYQETSEAIEACIAGIRSITAAPLIVTLSPVPVDSVIGLDAKELKSAMEVDCVSKSRLRSAFDEILLRQVERGDLYYFPSFEIVRWIAPVTPIPNFGLDDAASRHVSSPILDAICGSFLRRFIRWSPAADAVAPVAEAVS